MDKASEMKFSEIQVGQTAILVKTMSDRVIRAFADATGDHNPLHLDEEYARATYFKGRIAHGMLVAGMFSNILGTELPGAGTIYLKQELNFRAPVRPGDTVRAEVRVLEKRDDKRLLKLETRAFNQSEELVVDGFALVMVFGE